MHAHLCMCAYAWLRYTAGPAEYMGTIGICPIQLLKKSGFFVYYCLEKTVHCNSVAIKDNEVKHLREVNLTAAHLGSILNFVMVATS